MVIQGGAHEPRGEDSSDLLAWLGHLSGAPEVHQTVLLVCERHDNDSPTWQYVEADAAEGLARRRCLSCANVVGVLDSDARWTFPPMIACKGCGHSIVEVGAAISVPDGQHVEWVVVGVRCVECGRLTGVTDLVVDHLPVDQVLAGL